MFLGANKTSYNIYTLNANSKQLCNNTPFPSWPSSPAESLLLGFLHFTRFNSSSRLHCHCSSGKRQNNFTRFLNTTSRGQLDLCHGD